MRIMLIGVEYLPSPMILRPIIPPLKMVSPPRSPEPLS